MKVGVLQKKFWKLLMKWYGFYIVFEKINDVLYRVGKYGNYKGDIIYYNILKNIILWYY